MKRKRIVIFLACVALSQAAHAADVPARPSPSSLVHVAPYVATSADVPKGATTALVTQTTAPGAPAVVPVVVDAAQLGPVTFHVSPIDIDLRDALEHWLAGQGWQLAWTVQDSMPIAYEATFTGKDIKDVLWQVMQATDHMSTPSRVCRHIKNHVVRVVGRHVDCKE